MSTPASIRHYRFTVDDYFRMGEVGILDEDDRVELLEGEIVEMTPIGYVHASVVSRLNALLAPAVPGRAIVRVQDPAILSDFSAPQPTSLSSRTARTSMPVRIRVRTMFS